MNDSSFDRGDCVFLILFKERTGNDKFSLGTVGYLDSLGFGAYFLRQNVLSPIFMLLFLLLHFVEDVLGQGTFDGVWGSHALFRILRGRLRRLTDLIHSIDRG